MSVADKLLEGTDIGPKFERIRAVFDEEFGLLTHDERIFMLLQVTTQQAAIILSDGVREKACEARGENPNMLGFLMSMRVSAERTSAAFAQILDTRIANAGEATLRAKMRRDK